MNDVALAILTTALVVIAPGWLVCWAARIRPLAAVAAAPPVSFGLIGFTAWFVGDVGIDWSWHALVVATAITCVLALLGRIAVRFARNALKLKKRNQHTDETQSPQSVHNDGAQNAGQHSTQDSANDSLPSDFRRRTALAVTSLVVAAVSAISIARGWLALNSLSNGAHTMREAWDMQWHYNFLEYTRQTGIASSTLTGGLYSQETGSEHFYPSGWHAAASLLPGGEHAPAVLQANVFAVIAPALILPAGIAWLTWHVFAAGSRLPQLWPAAPLAAVAALWAPEIWVSLLATSSMPYLASVCVIPAALVLFFKPRVVPIALALVGVLALHPASAMTLAIFAVTWWLGSKRRWRVLPGVLLGGLLGIALSWPLLESMLGQSETVASFTGQMDLERGESLLWTLTGTSRYLEYQWWFLIPALAALAGLILLATKAGGYQWWPLVTTLILGVVAESAQVRIEAIGDVLQSVGSFYYDMSYRLQAPIGLLRLVGIGVAIAALLWVCTRAFARRRQASRTTAVFISMVLTVALVPVTWLAQPLFADAATRSDGRFLMTQADLEAASWLATQPKAHEGLILNNQHEGSGMMYALEGLPTLYRHYSFSDDDAELSQLLFGNIDLATDDAISLQDLAELSSDKPAGATGVNAAIEELEINYVVSSPPSVRASNPANLSMRSWAWWSPGLTPIYSRGATTIYAVDRQFTEAQIEQMLEDSPEPPGSPNPVWAPPRQPILPANEDTSPLIGSSIAVRIDDESQASRTVVEHLRDNGATVTVLHAEDGAADGAEDSAVATSYSFDAVIDLTATDEEITEGITDTRTEKDAYEEQFMPSGAGFAVAGLYNDAASNPYTGVSADILQHKNVPFEVVNQQRRTWQLAAGLRDALVFRGFEGRSDFDQYGTWGKVRDGLAPTYANDVFRTQNNATTGIPGSQVFLGSPYVRISTGSQVDDRAAANRLAQAISEGIASMLRQ